MTPDPAEHYHDLPISEDRISSQNRGLCQGHTTTNSLAMKLLPEAFCWTRFGTEAAERIEDIFARKERERSDNGGMFLWGIGNAIGPSLVELLRAVRRPFALFSPIASKPRIEDVNPSSVAIWRSGVGLDGKYFTLPKFSKVTSRFDTNGRSRGHYALVCHSKSPLQKSGLPDRLNFSELRNFRTDRPIGASQVTAVVRRCERMESQSRLYEVAVAAELVYPYLVRLTDPEIEAVPRQRKLFFTQPPELRLSSQ